MNGEKNRNGCKRWRDKLKEDQVKFKTFKLKKYERNRNARQEKKMAEGDDKIIEERKIYERKRELRKKVKELKCAEKNEILPYSCKQTWKSNKKIRECFACRFETKSYVDKSIT